MQNILNMHKVQYLPNLKPLILFAWGYPHVLVNYILPVREIYVLYNTVVESTRSMMGQNYTSPFVVLGLNKTPPFFRKIYIFIKRILDLH